MLSGLYKVEFETPRGKGIGVIYAHDGVLHGGSGTFAYVGVYQQVEHSVKGVITTKRHTENADDPSVFGFNAVRISFSGFEKTGFACIEGTADEAPGLAFKATLTYVAE